MPQLSHFLTTNCHKEMILLLFFLGFSLHCTPTFQWKNSSENTVCSNAVVFRGFQKCGLLEAFFVEETIGVCVPPLFLADNLNEKPAKQHVGFLHKW